MLDSILRRFEAPDETRTFPRGRFELVSIAGVTVGRASYEPGWRWSVDVGEALGKQSCDVEHVGIVLSGCADITMDDGRVFQIRQGDLFYIPPGHDSSVVGDEQYVSLHLLGAGDYARHQP
jgi:quercetin dioxygenase-like cupin family protein